MKAKRDNRLHSNTSKHCLSDKNLVENQEVFVKSLRKPILWQTETFDNLMLKKKQ